MARGSWTGRAGRPTEEEVEQALRDAGPLLRRRADVGPADPAFVARLRAHLVSEGVVQRDGGTSVALPPVLAPPSSRWRLRGVAAGLVAALAAVLIAIVALVPGLIGRPHHSTVAWRAPLPSLADLTRALPAAPVAHGATVQSPLVSRAASPHGVPYAGHISLTGPPLPPRPQHLRAFRLMAAMTVAAPARLARLAHALGIRAAPYRLTQAGATWIVVAERRGASPAPLHSLAASAATGEVIYHDASYRWQGTWIDNSSAVAAARTWLAQLGWPGARMPLVAITHSGIPFGLRQIEFGWVGVGASATIAATLWVTPHGHVVEADLWPPVEDTQALLARSLAAAWAAVRGGLAPLTVEGVQPQIRVPGQGVMRRVTVTAVLSTGSDHRLYLVPTYQFAGKAVLRGIQGAHNCAAFTSAGGSAAGNGA